MDHGYARVSTLDQDPQLQLDALERAGCWPIVQEKASGVAAHRPVRDELLRQLKAGDTLTVWKLDRLGRSTLEVLQVVEDLTRRGVRFRCVTQPIDTSTPMGKSFLQLLAVFAELERNLILERTMAGKARRAAEGKHPGGARRFGVEADHETIREPEAELLREAAARLLAGESASSVVEDFNDRGIPTPSGGTWQVTPLRNMLLNPRAVPILGQDTYDALVRLFRAPGRQRLGRPAEHLLSGILRCTCGQAMYVKHTGKGQTVYYCQKAEGSGGRSQGCGRVNVSERAADRWAMEAFIAAAASDEFAEALNQRLAALLAGEMTAEQLDDWRTEIAELEQVLPTRFGTETMRRRLSELQILVHQATDQLMHRPDLQALLDLPRSEALLRAVWDEWTTAERRTWLRRVVEHVTVKPATTMGRGSDVAARLDPRWKVFAGD